MTISVGTFETTNHQNGKKNQTECARTQIQFLSPKTTHVIFLGLGYFARGRRLRSAADVKTPLMPFSHWKRHTLRLHFDVSGTKVQRRCTLPVVFLLSADSPYLWVGPVQRYSETSGLWVPVPRSLKLDNQGQLEGMRPLGTGTPSPHSSR